MVGDLELGLAVLVVVRGFGSDRWAGGALLCALGGSYIILK